jgi:hypothetical protein
LRHLLEDPAVGPESRAELADSLSLALLALLERLTPATSEPSQDGLRSKAPRWISARSACANMNL